ncbi:SRPBCC domain-containing protein [Aquipuribacter sp. MA13-6]|uniref:SRPBCC domain-containing protein n=1 Tax=unclassified Aquipuribacter TaxID=2635084 RepID=UPI003EED78F2
MELQHRFHVPIGIDEAWTTFNDLERIAPCLPGAQLTSLEGDEFAGKAKVKVGPVSMQFAGSGRFVERDEAGYRAVLEATGKDSRGNGTAAATVTARLEADGDGTNVIVDTDLKVSGKVAQFGKSMISEIGGKLLDQFASCLAETLAAGDDVTEAAPTTTPADVATSAGTTASAAGAGAGASVQDVAPADLRPAGSGPVGAPDPAVPSHTPQAGPTASTTGTTSPIPPRRAFQPQPEPEALDLGSVLLPTLLRRYGPLVAAGLVAGLVGWLLGRRSASA